MRSDPHPGFLDPESGSKKPDPGLIDKDSGLSDPDLSLGEWKPKSPWQTSRPKSWVDGRIPPVQRDSVLFEAAAKLPPSRLIFTDKALEQGMDTAEWQGMDTAFGLLL